MSTLRAATGFALLGCVTTGALGMHEHVTWIASVYGAGIGVIWFRTGDRT